MLKYMLYDQTFLYVASIYTQFKIVLYYIRNFEYANKQVLNYLNSLYHQRLNKIQCVLRRRIERIGKHNFSQYYKQSIIIKSII